MKGKGRNADKIDALDNFLVSREIQEFKMNTSK